MKQLFTILLGALIALVCMDRATAQDRGEIKIKITKEIDGERKTFERTYASEEEMKSDNDYLEFAGDDYRVNFFDIDEAAEVHKVIQIASDHDRDVNSFVYEFSSDTDMEDIIILESKSDAIDKRVEKITRRLSETMDVKEVAEIERVLREELASLPHVEHFYVSSGNIHIEEVQGEEFGNRGTVEAKDELELQGLRFSPNPSDGKFQLKFQVPEEGDMEVSIYDLEGKQVFNSQFDRFKGIYNESIDLSNQPKGLYLLEVRLAKKRMTKKIVIN